MSLPTFDLADRFHQWFSKVKRWLRPTEGYIPQALAIDGREWAAVKERLRHALANQAQKPHPATPQEQTMIERIQAAIKQANRNNITRTHVYWEIAQTHPELHWALLAHAVSRNGGWNMTDLQGEWLPDLMSREERFQFFRFLETANAYIFEDAYPQLLLYIESRRHKEPLFHLLPHFHVSRFMKPFWDSFWRTGHSPLLTLALIVNEQHYIEERIVRHPYFREKVLNHVLFKAQSLFQLNQVLIPHEATSAQTPTGDTTLSLCGVVVETFSSLDERIQIGKALYGLLYQPEVLEGFQRFAAQQRHTGSRADYWPQLFSPVRHTLKPKTTGKLNGCELLDAADPVYSPQLHTAWPNQRLVEPDRHDWYTDTSAFRYMRSPVAPIYNEMSDEYCFALQKMKTAAWLT